MEVKVHGNWYKMRKNGIVAWLRVHWVGRWIIASFLMMQRGKAMVAVFALWLNRDMLHG